MRRYKATGLVVGIAVWLGCVVAGAAWLQYYSASPGAMMAPQAGASAWLDARRAPDHALAVMVVHPRCYCTDASLSEFGDFLARAGDKCDALIVRVQAPASGGHVDLAGTPAGRELVGSRLVSVVDDPGGDIARLLGAETSGHVVLLDAAGHTRFYGGITFARGHRGRSAGQDLMLDAVANRRPVEMCGAPVYGCPLESPSGTCAAQVAVVQSGRP